MARFDLNDALQNTKPAPGRRFSLDDAMAQHGQAAPDQFAQTRAGIRQTQSERLPVNQSLPEGWQHNAAMVGSSIVKGVAGIPDGIIQTPRNVINLSKAGAGAQLMGLAALLQKGLGVGGGPEAMLDTLHTLGLDDTPSNPIPYATAIPAHPVTSGIDTGLQAVTGHGLEQPQTAGERIADWAIQGAAGAAAMTPASGLPGLMRSLATRAGVPATVLPMGIPAAANTLGNAVLMGGGSGLLGGTVAEVTGSPEMGMIASMGAFPVVSAVAGKIKNAPQVMTQGGRERNVGKFLRDNIKQPDVAVEQLRAAEPVFPPAADTPDIPVGPTTGQVLSQAGDNQILGVEKALTGSATPEGQMLGERYKANEAARAAQMERMVPSPVGGGADAVQRAVSAEVQRQLAVIERQRANTEAQRVPIKAAALSDAEAARQAVGDEVRSGEAGAVMGSAYDAASAREKKAAGSEFQIDPFNQIHDLPVPMDSIQSVMQEGYAGLNSEASAPIRKAIRLIDKAVADNTQRKLASVKELEPESVKMRRNGIDTTVDDIGTAIAKYGGISREDALRNGIDPNEINKRAAFGKPIFTENGMALDKMAESLSQDGYPVAYPGEGYSQNALLDALGEHMQGKKIYAPAGNEHKAAHDHYAEMLANYDPKNENSYLLFDENLNPVSGSDRYRMSYNQARVVDREIGDLQRSSTPGTNEYRMLGQLKDAVRKSFDLGVESGAIPADTAAAYKQAIAGYREYASTYKDGAMKGMQKDYGGNRKTPDAAIPKKLLTSGREAADSFQRAIGNEPGVAKTAQDWLATQWRKATHKPDGGLKPSWRDASAKFIDAHADILKMYPDLQAKLQAAVTKSKSAEDLAVRMDAEIKAANDRAMAKGKDLTDNSGASWFTKDVDAPVALKRFLESKSRTSDGRFILQLAKRDPEFRGSMNAAIRDHILGMRNDADRIKFIRNPENRALVRSLFGEKMLGQWEKVAADAARDRLRDTENAARDSGTANRGIGLKIAGKVSGQNKWIDLFRAVGEFVGGKERDILRAEAMTDPKTAANLLEKANNVPTLGQATKRTAGLIAPSVGGEKKERPR